LEGANSSEAAKDRHKLVSQASREQQTMYCMYCTECDLVDHLVISPESAPQTAQSVHEMTRHTRIRLSSISRIVHDQPPTRRKTTGLSHW